MSGSRTRATGVAIACLLVLAGCFGGAEVAVGPCTLKVAADEQGQWRYLEQPPFTIHLGTAASQTTNGPSALIFSGQGWQSMNVLLRHVSGEQVTGTLSAGDITGETTGYVLTRPGSWEVRLSDSLTGCQRVFTVEAIAP